MEIMNLIPAAVETAVPTQGATGPWLTVLAAFPALVALAIWLVPGARKAGREVAILASIIELIAFVALAFAFDWTASATTQFLESHEWIPLLGVSWSLGVSALGLTMLLLTALLVPLVLIASKGETTQGREPGGYAALVMLLYAFVVLIFSAYDLVVFYVAFEAMLVPVFFMVSWYGITEGRRKAAMKFLLYSLAGGLIMLGGVVVIYARLAGELAGSQQAAFLFRYDVLTDALPSLTIGWQLAVFIPLFLAFAIKAPMVPLHTWLPDTAAAARPGTSVLLVGVLDKIGTFGMITMLITFLPLASQTVRPVILVFAVISILWGGFAANGQKNLLRLVSFTSVSHFGFIVLGIFIGSEIALTGAMFFMIAHGLSIAGLFLISGFLIERGDDASVMGYGGMQRVTPVLAGTWLFAGLASIALPGLSGFVPEFLVLMGTYKVSAPLALFSVLGVILAALYILMPYQRIFTGPVNPVRADIPDLDTRERWVIAPLIAGMVILGVWSAPLLGSLDQVSEGLANKIDYSQGVTSGEASAAPALGLDDLAEATGVSLEEGTSK